MIDGRDSGRPRQMGPGCSQRGCPRKGTARRVSPAADERRSAAGASDPHRSCGRVDSRSRDDEGSPTNARRRSPRSCDCRPRGAAAPRWSADDAPDLGASHADDELERLAVRALTENRVRPRTQLQDPAQGIDHVRPRLLTRSALALSPWHLGNRGDNPPLVAGPLQWTGAPPNPGHCGASTQAGQGQSRPSRLLAPPTTCQHARAALF